MRRSPELVLRSCVETGPKSITLGTRHLSLGRAPDNDLVIPDADVSRHHAIVWHSDDGIFLRDLGSANGTFVDGERMSDTIPLRHGSRIRLGTRVELEVSAPALVGGLPGLRRAVAVEDLSSQMRWPLHSDRFTIGPSPFADLRLEVPEAEAVVLLVYSDGEVWLGRDEDDARLEIGAVFSVGPATFRLIEVDMASLPTVQPEERYPYRLRVALHRAGGPWAEIAGIQGGARHEITAENRVVLLYLLARKFIEDRDAGVALEQRGWCADDDIVVGVWGKGALASGANRLKVLVHRVRKELKEDQFEPWCIEKKSGLIRARFAAVELL